MRYALSLNRFDYIDRGEARTLVLIPGWASDSRIFTGLDLSYNYLAPENLSPFDFKESLMDAIEERGIKKISLFGWSLGGFLAQEFAMEYPDLIDRLILVSVRKGYKEEELSEIRKNLKRSKEGYLYKFYSQCFSSAHNLSIFKRGLLKSYLKAFSLEELLDSLDYLGSQRIDTVFLNGLKDIKIVHGRHDRIAPIEEAIEIARIVEGAELKIVEGAGHIPFLESLFNKELL